MVNGTTGYIIVSKIYKATWVFAKTDQGLSKLGGKIKAMGILE